MPNQFLINTITSSSYTYVGEAAPNIGKDEACWRIMRITADDANSETNVFFGDGVDTMSLTWNDRCALSYDVSGGA